MPSAAPDLLLTLCLIGFVAGLIGVAIAAVLIRRWVRAHDADYNPLRRLSWLAPFGDLPAVFSYVLRYWTLRRSAGRSPWLAGVFWGGWVISLAAALVFELR